MPPPPQLWGLGAYTVWWSKMSEVYNVHLVLYVGPLGLYMLCLGGGRVLKWWHLLRVLNIFAEICDEYNSLILFKFNKTIKHYR